MSATEINIVVSEFHTVLFKLLKICQKIDPHNIELEWMRKQLSLARSIDPLLIINKCSNKIWAYREQIIEENEVFFLHNKYSTYIKNDENKSFINEFINLLKTKFVQISTAEKKMLWSLMQSMLTAIVKYKKATGDFV